MAGLVTVRFNTDDLKALADPRLMAIAEAQMIEAGIEIIEPLARDEAPRKTGRGSNQIIGVVERKGSHPVGRVHAGKAFWLRILATGTYKRPGGYTIEPFRFRAKRRSKQAMRALGPARSRGALRALRFRMGGAVLFRGSVRHPGLQPDTWMDRAARRGEAPVAQAAEAIAERALNRGGHG